MAEAEQQVAVLTALIELAHVQLVESWAEVRDQNTYALSLAALGVAAIGIVAAVQGSLGRGWWAPIPGLAVMSGMALIGTRVALPGLGPDPERFFDSQTDARARDAMRLLLADLVDTRVREVQAVMHRQRLVLLWVLLSFVVTAAYSTLVLV